MEHTSPQKPPRLSNAKPQAFKHPTPKVYILPIKIADYRKCTSLDSGQITNLVNERLRERMAELKIPIAKKREESEIQVEIELTKLDPGSRLLRATIFLGAAETESVVTFYRNGKPVDTFPINQSRHVGFQGGNSHNHLVSSLKQIGFMTGSRLGGETGKITNAHSKQAIKYLMVGSLASWSLALLVTGGLYFWAISKPFRHDGFAQNRKWIWALTMGLFLAAALHIIALAIAPTPVLESKPMLLLRNNSGVKTLKAQRIVIGLIALFPIFLFVIWFGTL